MKYFKLILGSCCLLVSLSVSAGTQFEQQDLQFIATAWAGDAIYVDTVQQLRAEGCTKKAKLLPTHPLFKEMSSLLISALHAQKKVRLYIDGCLGDYMNLQAVKVDR